MDVLIMGEELLKVFVKRCDERSHKYIITREEAKNIHYHCQLHLSSGDDIRKLRMRIKSDIEFTKMNLQFLKIKTDEQRHLSYILKEGVVVYNNLLDNEKLIEEIEKAKTIHLEHLESKKNLTFTQKLVINYQPITEKFYSFRDRNEYIRHIISYIVDQYTFSNLGFDQSMVDKWVNVIYSKYYYTTQIKDRMERNYMKKYFTD